MFLLGTIFFRNSNYVAAIHSVAGFTDVSFEIHRQYFSAIVAVVIVIVTFIVIVRFTVVVIFIAVVIFIVVVVMSAIQSLEGFTHVSFDIHRQYFSVLPHSKIFVPFVASIQGWDPAGCFLANLPFAPAIQRCCKEL